MAPEVIKGEAQDAVGSSCWFLCFFRNGNKKRASKKETSPVDIFRHFEIEYEYHIFLWQRNCRLTLSSIVLVSLGFTPHPPTMANEGSLRFPMPKMSCHRGDDCILGLPGASLFFFR